MNNFMCRLRIWIRLVSAALVVTNCCQALQAARTPIPLNFDKNSVQFIFRQVSGTNFVPVGTCFLVNVRTIHKPNLLRRVFIPPFLFLTYKPPLVQNGVYVVTAKHVLFDENGKLREGMCLRTPLENGGVVYAYLNQDFTNGNLRIITPTDKSVDLAVFTLGQPRRITTVKQTAAQKMKLGWFDAALVSDETALKRYHVREGDEMFFVGLFTPFYGSKKNIPICRFGHLSMLPDEPIVLSKDNAQHLYLMETEAFGGNSGSPAFFSFPQSSLASRFFEWKNHQQFFSDTDHIKILFAGVVNAYFLDLEQIKFQNTSVTPYSQGNTGIASIVPAHYLYEILYSDHEREFRKKEWRENAPAGYNKN